MDANASPPMWRWVLGFLAVGACWGLTTPFMRQAAVARDKQPEPNRPFLTDSKSPWLKRKALGVVYAVLDLLRNPAYAIPLLLNITGSVWFFLLIGQAGKNFCVAFFESLRLCSNLRNRLIRRRAEFDCSDHELGGIFVHCDGRMVGRWKGHFKR